MISLLSWSFTYLGFIYLSRSITYSMLFYDADFVFNNLALDRRNAQQKSYRYFASLKLDWKFRIKNEENSHISLIGSQQLMSSHSFKDLSASYKLINYRCSSKFYVNFSIMITTFFASSDTDISTIFRSFNWIKRLQHFIW